MDTALDSPRSRSFTVIADQSAAPMLHDVTPAAAVRTQAPIASEQTWQPRVDEEIGSRGHRDDSLRVATSLNKPRGARRRRWSWPHPHQAESSVRGCPVAGAHLCGRETKLSTAFLKLNILPGGKWAPAASRSPPCEVELCYSKPSMAIASSCMGISVLWWESGVFVRQERPSVRSKRRLRHDGQ